MLQAVLVNKWEFLIKGKNGRYCDANSAKFQSLLQQKPTVEELNWLCINKACQFIVFDIHRDIVILRWANKGQNKQKCYLNTAFKWPIDAHKNELLWMSNEMNKLFLI